MGSLLTLAEALPKGGFLVGFMHLKTSKKDQKGTLLVSSQAEAFISERFRWQTIRWFPMKLHRKNFGLSHRLGEEKPNVLENEAKLKGKEQETKRKRK